MKKILILLTLFATLLFTATAFADYSGLWMAGETGYYFSSEGNMQLWDFSSRPAAVLQDYYCNVEETDEGWSLIPFQSPVYYVQRFADRDGWMDLTDTYRVTTSWLNSTPEDVANKGLEPDPDNPLVGVWTQMTDDLTAPCFQFYDDAYFDYSDLLGVEQTQEMFGMYQLENGLLCLYTEDTGLNVLLTLEDGNLLINGEKATPATMDGLLPTAATLVGTWESDETTIAFMEDGTVSLGGIQDYGYWTLCGGRLIISSDDPIWSFASFVSFASEDESTLLIRQADGELEKTYTRK